ncbi:putative transcriptional regulator [Salsuginibacillus halophilus]|uniref:Putative transcriptional regulator n=1 Tax=Salsuginibacillus halophilus TaxID=517424 RepID=A0A2P8H4X8_9BACI|nr:helix-turn-helix transcriptional regulator [Salsuginibacillus halophilus]PSL41271.1 putative transcriptional regulator [Salsuginibacillus halophilus]
MIIFKLDDLLKQLDCTESRLSKQSGIRPNTINDMCHNKTKRIEMNTLSSILKALNEISEDDVCIEDLIEYVKEDKYG